MMLSEILENDYGECTSFSEERMQYLKMVPQGGNWRSLPEEAIKAAMGGAYESGGGKVGFLSRLDYKQPAPTLVTSPVQRHLCYMPSLHQNRPLSVKRIC